MTCFKWVMLSALFPASAHADRLSNHVPQENAIVCSSLRFPVNPKHFPLFERNNPIIAIHCLAYDDFSECLSILYLLPQVHLRPHKISLLLLDSSNSHRGAH